MYRQASRKSYRKYREEVRARPADNSYSPHGSGHNKKQPEKPVERQRSLTVLLREFWEIAQGASNAYCVCPGNSDGIDFIEFASSGSNEGGNRLRVDRAAATDADSSS